MSIVNRAQFLKTILQDFPTATPLQTFDVPRPETTPKEPAYAENTDHVTKLPSLDEDYAGEVTINLASTLLLATCHLRVVEIRKLLPTAQKGVAGPGDALFPSGASADSEHVRYAVNEAVGFPLNGDVAQGFLGMEIGNAPGRTYPGITLRAGEYVRLAINNGSGGDLLQQPVEAKYSMGQHQSDVGRP